MSSAWEVDDQTPEEVAAQERLYGPFTEAVRDLVDVAILTEVDAAEVDRARAEIEAVTARLRRRQRNGSFGVRYDPAGGRTRAWGNAVVGLRNAVAPPLRVERDPSGDGRVSSDFHLGAAYEGPPGLVHGGVLALVLDQLLGESAGARGKPGMTGTLTLTYRRATPLGPLRGEAWIDRVEGVKTFAHGHLLGPEGATVEAQGVFILPRWARESATRPDRFE